VGCGDCGAGGGLYYGRVDRGDFAGGESRGVIRRDLLDVRGKSLGRSAETARKSACATEDRYHRMKRRMPQVSSRAIPRYTAEVALIAALMPQLPAAAAMAI